MNCQEVYLKGAHMSNSKMSRTIEISHRQNGRHIAKNYLQFHLRKLIGL